jgi:hypothetical protein
MAFTRATDPPINYAPVGRCIYCLDDGAGGLGDEHIIPYSLNGTQILPQASCRKCEVVTSKLDMAAARSVFHQVRASAGMRTRRRLPSRFPAILRYEDGREEHVMVPADVHPATLVLPHFSLPDLLSGRSPDGSFRFTTPTWMRAGTLWDEYVKSRGAAFGEVEVKLDPTQFSRFLSKVAYGYAVAQLGINGFKPLILDLIHGRNLIQAPELVGCDSETPPPASGVMHQLDLVSHPDFIVVRIRLLASSSIDGEHAMPVYLVVAGTNI